jgi:hypothetical protein
MATWSPDDAWIAFQRAGPAAATVALVPAAGGEVVQLVPAGGNPAWR